VPEVGEPVLEEKIYQLAGLINNVPPEIVAEFDDLFRGMLAKNYSVDHYKGFLGGIIAAFHLLGEELPEQQQLALGHAAIYLAHKLVEEKILQSFYH